MSHSSSPTPPQAEAAIDCRVITANAALLKGGSSAELMAVVKADGYGHGAVESARASLAGGATWLGVCTVDEAVELREAGIREPILSWLNAPGALLASALENNVDLSVSDASFLEDVLAAARATGRTAKIHLKIDTGLGRNGSPASAWQELCVAAAKAQAENAIRVVGIWSHFAYADAPGHPTIASQIENFEDALDIAGRNGIDPDIRHLANSAASMTLPRAHYDMIRPGIALYGLHPIPEAQDQSGLRPAMTLQGRVALTKRVPAEHGVSYGHAYVTPRETTLALVPIGYADGVSRAASNIGPLQLGGKRRAIAGRVCMDQIVVDIGDDHVSAGDLAVLFGPGDDGEPTAHDWAERLDTIAYEIVTRFGIGARIRRTYLR